MDAPEELIYSKGRIVEAVSPYPDILIAKIEVDIICIEY